VTVSALTNILLFPVTIDTPDFRQVLLAGTRSSIAINDLAYNLKDWRDSRTGTDHPERLHLALDSSPSTESAFEVGGRSQRTLDLYLVSELQLVETGRHLATVSPCLVGEVELDEEVDVSRCACG